MQRARVSKRKGPQFTIPAGVRRRAKEATEEGDRVLLSPSEVMDMMVWLDKYMNKNGEAVELMDTHDLLSERYEDPARRLNNWLRR